MKFLEDLKKELRKQGMNDFEINEIIQDHQEMISEAQLEGLKDEDIPQKFGNPVDLANELAKNADSKETQTTENGYTLYKSFEASDLKKMKVVIVSDDLVLESSNQDTVEVYMKKIKNPEDYEVKMEDGKFSLELVRKKKGYIFNNKSGYILIKYPNEKRLEKVDLTSVSGEVKITNLEAEKGLIKTTSGDSNIFDIDCKEVKIQTVSGDAKVHKISSKDCDLSSVSGDFEAEDLTIENKLYCNSVSGDFVVTKATCSKGTFQTVSGDMRGVNFYPQELTLQSVSGDITIENEDQSHIINIVKKRTLSGDIKIK